MSRDNERWIKELTGVISEQASALTDLRIELLRVAWALAHYAQADDSFIEDCVQETLVLIIDRIGQFEGRSMFLTWATTIAIRTAVSDLRRRRWKDVSLDRIVFSRVHLASWPYNPNMNFNHE